MFLTVIICSHRRPDRVRYALGSLTRQTHQGDDWEVLVVENDDTPSRDMQSVVDEFSDKLRIRYCLEPKPNLSRARNLGANEATGEYIVYLDDDAEADAGWLEAIIAGCTEYTPDFAGGPSKPLYRTPKPYWYKDEYGSGYIYGTDIQRLDNTLSIGGMNYIVRRDLVSALGGFDERLGMAGSTIAYGEDTELLRRARSIHKDLKVYYFPEALVYHEVRPEKMTLKWRTRSGIANASSYSIYREKPFPLRFVLKRVTKSLFQIILAIPMLICVLIVDIARPHKALWKRYVVDKINPHIFTIVHFSAQNRSSQDNS